MGPDWPAYFHRHGLCAISPCGRDGCPYPPRNRPSLTGRALCALGIHDPAIVEREAPLGWRQVERFVRCRRCGQEMRG